ncbi:DNA polymerase III subunit chi [Pseudoalteromonas luteoviolacea]|uniref:DNA polymerase III subunit chi n=1 Tax=Pseudoalteromonas luteoviolacea DSM 6061 TaxID=1365250 RepID=A0A167BNJ3_9GAMM|nr:DNA polymerase III subunit chi [Pseudoalteromonas luteoviolacea]KZN46734.1 DNA polymerase III subunit chi [Pseudoalteromonas luteoviolacea DSM 6061]KZN50601.1 DNA polymerase III subunit chi [Pseudoalteromonas luteoviolacea CPMOR-2]MBE0384939.1 DNA polymerase III subunit chi [Pseudoalteromonas luteoviolacea DSM 6061]TQF69620.1 DNA polymerase III subunit chi [Pseudoalteromonas luteoviolacea]
MSINARFFVLKHDHEPNQQVSAHFDLAARSAAKLYRAGQRVFIYVDNVEDAHAIDEYLWQFDAESFVPHNLQGEGPKGGAPVEIGQMPPVGRRTTLINLATHIPDFVRRFEQVYDFVPVESHAKQAARERFKQLRAIGANISTKEIDN